MIKATLKSLTAHTSRLLMSILSIVLGISFVVGVMTFNRMINSTFDALVASVAPDSGIFPKGTYDEKADGGVRAPGRITSAEVDKVRAVDGVEAAYGSTWRPNTFLLDRNGKVMRTAMAPNLGGNYFPGKAYLGKTAQKIVNGRGPTTADEVAIDRDSMKKGGFSLGDSIEIAIAEAGKHRFTIVGELMWGESTSAGATYAAFSDATMQQYFSEGRNEYDTMWIVAKSGVDVKELTTRINDQVKIDGSEAYDGAFVSGKMTESIRKETAFLGTFLMVFAIIALVVGMFLIVNTFSIIVAQRSRELALFRTMGASRGQVRRSVLLEATVVGLIGSALGVFGGWGLAAAMKPLVNREGEVLSTVLAPDVGTIITAMMVGTLTTVVAAYIPARKAAKVPPIVAMSGEMATGEAGLGKRAIIGSVMAAIGATLLMLGLFVKDIPHALTWVGVGAGLTMIGVAIASPLLGWPFTWLMDKIYCLLFGEVGHLAATNSTRNPRRTAATASALMIGVTLVTTMGILGGSVQRSSYVSFEEKLHTDAIVESSGFSGWKPAVTQQMRTVSGVDNVWTMTMGTVMDTTKQKPISLTGVDPDMFNRVMDQKFQQGRQFSAVNEVTMETGWAQKNGYTTGDAITGIAHGVPITLTVVGIFENPKGMGMGAVQTARQTLLNQHFPDLDYVGFVQYKPGADPKAVIDGLNKTTADYPMITVTPKMEFAKAQTKQIDQLLTMIYALLAIAVIIAIFGVVNTLVLSIIERKREIGLLRSVGLTRRQLRMMIGLESVVIALLGAVLGMGMGLVFGVALQKSMAAKGITELAITWPQLGMYAVTAIVAGVLAAVVPSIRASHLNVLDAVKSD